MTNKDLLKKYVDTGIKLPEYQVNNLTDNLKKTYIRKRLIAYQNFLNHNSDYFEKFENYEFNLFTPEQKQNYVKSRLEKKYNIPLNEFLLLSPDERLEFVKLKIKRYGKENLGEYIKDLTPEGRYEILDEMGFFKLYEEIYDYHKHEGFDFLSAINMLRLYGGIPESYSKLLTPGDKSKYFDAGGKIFNFENEKITYVGE